MRRLAECLQNGADFSEKLENPGPAEQEDWPPRHKESGWQGRQSRFCQRKKERSH